MKINLIYITIILISSVGLTMSNNSNKKNISNNNLKCNSIKYKICKIDSINNYYLIYAKKDYSYFKIISKKEKPINCKNQIVVNKIYKLKLHSMLNINGHSAIPLNQINEISGWKVDKNTTIIFEGDSIRDFYTAENVKGLCFFKNK